MTYCVSSGTLNLAQLNRVIWQDLATHTRVTPAARQASLIKLAQTINRTPAAKAELDKWGLMIDEKLMEVCVIKSY